MKKILFIGSHLSKIKGTKSASESVKVLLNDSFEIKLSSTKLNQLGRFFEIIKDSLFYDYEIMHIDIYSGKALVYANISSLIAKIRNKKIIMNLHGGRLNELHSAYPEKLSFLKRANKLITPSLFLKQYFEKYDYSIHRIPNYINKKNFPYIRNVKNKFTILWVRAFNNIYQPELAVKIVASLLASYPNLCLTMIGPDKGYLKKTKRLIKELELDNNINIVGKVANDELYKYYQSNSIYINTTKYESFGLAILEAASCGIPIVSTNVGEIPYIWEKDKEILLCESNEYEFKKHIASIFESEELEKNLSQNARRKSEEFDGKSVKKQWEKIIENI